MDFLYYIVLVNTFLINTKVVELHIEKIDNLDVAKLRESSKN